MSGLADNQFAVGAIVELKSGGPAMTVRKIIDGVVSCEWFKDGTLKTFSFESHSLQLSTKIKTHEQRLAELEELGRDDE